MTYADKLRDPRWKAKRAEIVKRRNYQCEDCQIMQAGHDWFVQFDVHHRYYEKGREPWEYPDDALACLCWRCHEQHHYAERVTKSRHWPAIVALAKKLTITVGRDEEA